MSHITIDQFIKLLTPRNLRAITPEETRRIEMFCNAFPEHDLLLRQVLEKPHTKAAFLLREALGSAIPFINKLLSEMLPDQQLAISMGGEPAESYRAWSIAGAVITIDANPSAYRKLLKTLIACKRVFNNVAVKDAPGNKWILFFS